MKKSLLPLFIALFGILFAFVYHTPMLQFENAPKYKLKSRVPLQEKIAARAEDRSIYLKNVITGKVDPEDWYKALAEIKSKKGNLDTRAGDMDWYQNGPDNVGGRSRCFIFDNKVDNKCYVGGISGGIYVSNDLGNTWAPIPNMDEALPVMSVGCMSQSVNGEIYAGTGEYWGNDPNAAYGSQFFGNGIYKKEASSDEFKLLPVTEYKPNTTANNGGNFNMVIDIACDPEDNETVYAGTNNGLFKTTDGGTTFKKLSAFNGPVTEIKIALNGDLYAGYNGYVYKSTDKGNTFVNKIKNAEYQSNGNQHLCIALSHTNAQKLYACGITGSNGGNLKYVIKSEDGGDNWEFIGQGDNYLNGLCNINGGVAQCQGFYDLALEAHPYDDDIIFLGGAPNVFTWSKKFGWIQISNGYSTTLGVNQIHADQHHFAFNKKADTMIVCTDGGVYMSYNSFSNYPNKITWKPRNYGFNVTQFYDVAATRYGEMLGGAQDNGSQLTSLRGTTSNIAIEVKGGDGFDCAISAKNDYKVSFATTYYGDVARSADLNSNMKSVVSGSCVASGTGITASSGLFHTRIHLAESIVPNPENPELDSVEYSYLFGLSNNSLEISPNAYNPDEQFLWGEIGQLGLGFLFNAHQSKNLSRVYFCGTNGVKFSTNFRGLKYTITYPPPALKPCLSFTGLTFTTCKGLTGPGGGNIGSVFVDLNDELHVVAGQIGFGGTNKIFESTNGIDFVSKQGDLPIMPIYDCVIDPYDKKHVIVATEFGIWDTKDISASSPKWEEQNKNIGRVPVFRFEVRKLRVDDCYVLYAGSHSRGFWSVPFNPNNGCDYSRKARPENNKTNGIQNSNVQVDFNIFPNPASDVVTVSFDSKKAKTYHFNIYDMNGRLVKAVDYKAIPGNNIVKTNIENLHSGNYIVRLEDDTNVIGGKNLQVK